MPPSPMRFAYYYLSRLRPMQKRDTSKPFFLLFARYSLFETYVKRNTSKPTSEPCSQNLLFEAYAKRDTSIFYQFLFSKGAVPHVVSLRHKP